MTTVAAATATTALVVIIAAVLAVLVDHAKRGKILFFLRAFWAAISLLLFELFVSMVGV